MSTCVIEQEEHNSLNFQPVVYPFFLVAVQHLKQTPDTLGQVCFHNRESLKILRRRGRERRRERHLRWKRRLKEVNLRSFIFYGNFSNSLTLSNVDELFGEKLLRTMQNFCFNFFAAHKLGFKTRTCSPHWNSLFLTRDMKGSFLNAAFLNTCSFRLSVPILML